MQCAREPTDPRLRTARQVRALEERQLRLDVRGKLRDWAELALAPNNQVPAAHHLLLIEKLERVSRGEIDRLMLLLPPGSAKSTYASMLFPAWWFSQHPDSSVIAAAHTGGLARHFGHGVKTLVEAHSARLGYGLQRGASAERIAAASITPPAFAAR